MNHRSSPRFLARYSTSSIASAICCSILIPFFALLQAPTVSARQANVAPEIRPLDKNSPIEREMRGGETHVYKVALDALHYYYFVIEQRGIDVAGKLRNPANQMLVEAAANSSRQGRERFCFIPEVAGEYRIEVSAPKKEGQAGSYVIKVATSSSLSQKEKDRFAAQKLYDEAELLLSTQTKETLQQALSRYEAALALTVGAEDADFESDLLAQIGLVQGRLGDIKKALESFQKALPLSQAAGSRHLEGALYMNIGIAYSRSRDREKAIENYRRSLDLRHEIGDLEGEARSHNNLGLYYTSIGENLKALECFTQALPVKRAIGDLEGESIILNNIAGIHNNIGETRKAIEYFEQSLAIKRTLGDKSGEATTLNNLATSYYVMGEAQKSLEVYQQALSLHREAANRQAEAQTIGNLGAVYIMTDEKLKALELLNESLQIRREVGDRAGEASVFNNLATVAVSLGEEEKAFEYLQQTLSISRELTNSSPRAIALRMLGDLYTKNGEPQKALEHYNQSLALDRARNSRIGEAGTLIQIGAAQIALGETQQALASLTQGLEVSRAVDSLITTAGALRNIGLLHKSLGDYQKALDYYHQALDLIIAKGYQAFVAETNYYIAQAERLLGRQLQATAAINESLRLSESLRHRAGSQEMKASYFSTLQNYYEFAIDLLMQQKNAPTEAIASALQISERARARTLLETLNEAQADIHLEGSADLAERKKSLHKRLNAKAYSLTNRHSEKEATDLRNELEAITLELQQVEASIREHNPNYASLTMPRPLTLAEIQQQVVDADSLLLEYALGEERSYLWAITPTSVQSYQLPKRSEIEAAARQVADLLTARNKFILYETTDEKKQRVAQAEAQYPQAALALSRMLLAPVTAEMKNKRLLIVSDGALQYIPFAALPDPEASSQSPVAGNNANANRPPTTDYRPLIAGHEIVNLPSASTLAVLRREIKNRKPAPQTIAVFADPIFDKNDERFVLAQANRKRDASIVAQSRNRSSSRGNRSDHSPGAAVKSQTGNAPAPLQATTANAKARPAKPESDLRRAAREVGLESDELSLPRIPFTRQEAKAIAGLIPPSLRKEAIDFEANRAAVLSQTLSQYRYIHFATHGFLNPTHPELSGIALSMIDEEGKEQDGFVRAHEIYNLKLPAELVVLSGCRTGLGKEIRGEGLIGMTRGFMYAGSARVLVSLWDVNDEATAEFMSRFYKAMLGKVPLTAAAALRATQASMAKDKRWSAPYYWAAFVLQGEPK
jgi:CHAT domain-containing protein